MSSSSMGYFVKIEDEVQLADIPEVFIQHLHEHLHQLQHNQLVMVFVHDCYEVQTCVALVNDLVLFVVQEIAHLRITRDYQLVDLPRERLTSLRIRCFSDWERFSEYHLVSLDLPWRLMRKKQWIISNTRLYFYKKFHCQIKNHFLCPKSAIIVIVDLLLKN